MNVSGRGMCGTHMATATFTGTLVYAGQTHSVSLSCQGTPNVAPNVCDASVTFTMAGKRVTVSLSDSTGDLKDGTVDNDAAVDVTGIPWTSQPNVCIQPAGSTGVCSVP